MPHLHCLGSHTSLGKAKGEVMLWLSGCCSLPHLLSRSSVGCAQRANRSCKKMEMIWRTLCPSALSVVLPAPCIGSLRVGPVSIRSGLDLSYVPRMVEKILTFETCQEIVIVVCLKEMPAQQCGMFLALMLVQFSWSVCETLLLCSLPFSSAFQLAPMFFLSQLKY